MVVRLQCERSRVRANRRKIMPSSPDMWTELNWYLDTDERLVYPEAYLENRHLYSGIRSVVYLVRDRKFPDSGIEWVSESRLGDVMLNQDVDLLAKQLIVRIRLPWHKVPNEWLISQEELTNYPDDYDVIDTLVTVRRDDLREIPVFDVFDFETNRDDYEVVKVEYLVSPKLSTAGRSALLGVDPDSIQTYMQL